MKKRNILAILAALAAVLVAFTACGKKGDGDGAGGEATNATFVGKDGVVYEEVTEVVTDAAGEAVTGSDGETKVVTVTKPVPTTAPAVSDSADAPAETTAPEGETLDVELDASGKPTKTMLEKLSNEWKTKKAFYFNGTMTLEGRSINIKLYMKGTDCAMEMPMGATTVRIVYADNTAKMIFPLLKYYYTMPAESGDAFSMDEMMKMWDSIASEELDYVNTTSVKIDGKDYVCEAYSDGTNTNKYFFDSDGNLKRIEISGADGTANVMKVTECSANVDDSIFATPAGYRELTKDNIGALGNMFG